MSIGEYPVDILEFERFVEGERLGDCARGG